MNNISTKWPYCDHMDISTEKENGTNKREKEEMLRSHKEALQDCQKKPKIERCVRFSEECSSYSELVADLNEVALGSAFDFSKTAEEHGWIVTTANYRKLSIDPKALRNMTDHDLLHFIQHYRCFSNWTICDGKNITDSGLIQALLGRSNLQVMEVSLCPNITSKTLIALADNCPLLYQFSLLQNEKVRDEGIFALVTRCKALRSMSLDWCYGITDRSLRAIARNCPLLSELSLTEGTQFSLSAIREILQNCPWLEALDLWGCSQVSDAWIDTIIQWGHNIKTIDLKYCDKVSPQALVRLKSHFYNLTLTS